MSLYNALFGTNNQAPLLLNILGIDQEKKDAPIYPENWEPYDQGITEEGQKYIDECIEEKHWTSGRFRDIYLNEDGTKILLYTRNGGGNRESYPHIFEILAKHPNFLSDCDDDFDCTYCTYEFSVPEKFLELTKSLATGEEPKSISDKFQNLFKEMEKGKETPEVKKAKEVGENIFNAIEEGTQNIKI